MLGACVVAAAGLGAGYFAMATWGDRRPPAWEARLNDSPSSTSPRASGLAVFSWVLYDFANSAFPTLVLTFIFSTYFVTTVATDAALPGDTIWQLVIAVSGITVALVSPPLGAVADRGGFKREFLIGASMICIIATALLWFVGPGDIWLGIVLFLLANTAFETGLVFYNAFLPDLNRPEQMGQISGYGYALGYVGGLTALAVGLVAFVMPDALLGLEQETAVRATNLLVAGWFLLFALPQFLFVREFRTEAPADVPIGTLVRSSFGQLAKTYREVLEYPQVFRFLLARLLYNDGLATIFAFGGIYATLVFGFEAQELLYFGIALNVSAGVGSFAMGFLDDAIGGKRTVIISIIGLLLATIGTIVAWDKTSFFVSALFLGIFVGPNQSASRSFMGRIVPASKENEFFGFFAFSGKATSFIGPLVLAFMTWLTGDQRWGVAGIAVLLLAGLGVLMLVDEDAGIAQAREASEG
ncbi:MAG: MFS transporter [Myxococcota bacterium]